MLLFEFCLLQNRNIEFSTSEPLKRTSQNSPTEKIHHKKASTVSTDGSWAGAAHKAKGSATRQYLGGAITKEMDVPVIARKKENGNVLPLS